MPGEDKSRSALSRRQFLEHAGRGIAASAVGLPLLLEACAPPAPAAPTSAPAAAAPPAATSVSGSTSVSVAPTGPPAAAAVKPAGVLPTYVALTSKPKADFPAKDERYEDGYLNYP